jgi:hypothetical protein
MKASPGMTIPLKAISITFTGGGLIFEGLAQLCLGRNEGILPGLLSCNPSKSSPLR